MKFDFSKITSEQVEKLKALCVEFNLMPSSTAPIAQPTPTPAPVQKFGEGTLKDGTVIKWEGDAPLAVGTSLLVIDPSNPEAFLPMPDGEVELADGTKLVVKDSKVESLTPVTPVTPPAPDMTAQVAQMSEQLKEVSEKFEAVSKEKETLNVELSASKAEIESVKKSLEETNAKLKETLEMFSKVLEAPASEPIETPANKPMSGIGSKIKS